MPSALDIIIALGVERANRRGCLVGFPQLSAPEIALIEPHKATPEGKARVSPSPDRNDAIYRRHGAGETFASLARAFGLSGGRVAQIFHQEDRLRRRARALKHGWLAYDTGRSNDEWAAIYTLCGETRVRAMLAAAGRDADDVDRGVAAIEKHLGTLGTLGGIADAPRIELSVTPLFSLRADTGVWMIDAALEAA